ncbi:MAG: hydroxyacid dehydrogenase [Candidatus Bathyarchaeota archaeon]|nr:MAG: hydroxyacid dehydrogenase [Candidatus Bathyarchaeota archaeon]
MDGREKLEPKKVLVCDSIDIEGIYQLKQAGIQVDIDSTITPTQLEKVVVHYDALIVRSRTKVTKEILEAGTRLKAIGRAGVGLDNIDLQTAKQREISVLNTPEASAYAVAELVIGLMFSVLRNIPLADKTMKEGKWIKKELKGWQLREKTLGIIGFGGIGRIVGTIGHLAFNMKLLAYDPFITAETVEKLGGKLVSLEMLLQEADVVSIHVPLLSATRHMIGKKELAMMKPTAILINASRGGTVDEQALFEALHSKKLKGAALDVYEVEPPTKFEILRLPNVVCTPHIGGQTMEARKAISTILAKKLITTLKEK